MKNRNLFLTAMLAATLVFGLVLAGCDDGSGDDDPAPSGPDASRFYGTWTDGEGDSFVAQDQFGYLSVMCSPNSGGGYVGGTATLTATTIEFSGVTATYSFTNATTLVLSGVSAATGFDFVNGTYTKQ